MRIKLFKNIFGQDCYIYIEKINPNQQFIKYITNIFDSKCLLVSVTALDYNCEFSNIISSMKDAFELILPTNNIITSETKIISSKENILLYWDKLIDSAPRNITIYGFKKCIDRTFSLCQENVKKRNDIKVLKDKTIDFILSIVIEENFIVLSFNKFCFDFNKISKRIKAILENN